MMSDALLAYLHFATIFGLASLLAVELSMLVQPGTGQQLRRFRTLDGFYGMFAVLVLASGIARVVWGAKGSDFYLSNPVFHAKVGLFVLVGLLSIYPTIQFLKWSRAASGDTGYAPASAIKGRVRALILLQLALLAAMPLLAAVMARGIGIG